MNDREKSLPSPCPLPFRRGEGVTRTREGYGLGPAEVEHSKEFGSCDRRNFLKTALATAGVTAFGSKALGANKPSSHSGAIIDVNINLSRWPMRRVACDDTRELAEKLRSQGVTQAWAGSFDGLLHKDLASVNARLALECRKHGSGLLLPFGAVNPMLPDWEEELRRCAEEHRMRGIRLHPNYHGYKLDDPVFARLLNLAAERRLIVQVAVIMEDERMMHPLLRVPPVDTAPLVRLIKETPSLCLVLLNALGVLRGPALSELFAAGEVCVEISMLEGLAGIEKLLTQVPLERVLFGSYAPLYYLESALLKLKESVLTQKQLKAIQASNAQRLTASLRGRS